MPILILHTLRSNPCKNNSLQSKAKAALTALALYSTIKPLWGRILQIGMM
jgi:hypothetical protein